MNKSRREFIRKAGYVAPAVLTMSAMPAMANTGSGEIGQEVPNDSENAEPVRWQSRESRRAGRRLRRLNPDAPRFDWDRIDTETWTLKD